MEEGKPHRADHSETLSSPQPTPCSNDYDDDMYGPCGSEKCFRLNVVSQPTAYDKK